MKFSSNAKFYRNVHLVYYLIAPILNYNNKLTPWFCLYKRLFRPGRNQPRLSLDPPPESVRERRGDIESAL